MRNVELLEDEEHIFDIYFAGTVSMAHCHPACGRSNGIAVAPKLTVEECADIALEMIEVRRKVHGYTNGVWDSGMAYDE